MRSSTHTGKSVDFRYIVTSSYNVELKNVHKIFYPTIKIYKSAVAFCVRILQNEWSEIESLKDVKRKKHVESLIHSTKNNQAKYPEFDKQFFKLPRYMRHSAIHVALEHVSEYYFSLNKWKKSKRTTKKPVLRIYIHSFPIFYKKNTKEDTYDDSNLNANSVRLKLFVNNDWIWVPFRLKHTDLQYIRKHFAGIKITAPMLEKRHHKWFLRFSFREKMELKKKKEVVLGVDLGINTDATCCIMRKDGTILKRKFINFKSDKDYFYHTLNKIKKVSRLYGVKNTAKLWGIANFKNYKLAKKIADAIVDFALENNVDVIAFERLRIKGRIKGKNKEKLHMWKKNTIQNMVLHKAHRYKIHMLRVRAYNTSRLAYDGSGCVLRGEDAGLPTSELCQFTNGKIYNCDLSASYNIAARCLIRQIRHSSSKEMWLQAVNKVKSLSNEKLCTYRSYLELLNFAYT